MVLGVLAGAAISGGLGYLGNQQANDIRDTEREINLKFEESLRGAFQTDPLLNQLLGGLAGLQGQPFDADEAFERGQEQLSLTRQRREFDALRQLAAFGFDQGGAQEQFANRALGQQEGFETGALRNLVDTTAIQARPQALLGDFNLFTSLLGNSLGIGGQAGLLGNRVPSQASAFGQSAFGSNPMTDLASQSQQLTPQLGA